MTPCEAVMRVLNFQQKMSSNKLLVANFVILFYFAYLGLCIHNDKDDSVLIHYISKQK